MKKKILSILLCMVFLCTLSLPVYADSDSSSSDGYSAIISDIPTVCPTCGSALHASWRSTSGAEVELQISEAGKITIPAGAGVYAHFRLYCEKCGYSKSETRILGLDWGSEHPGSWEVKQAPSGIGRKDLPGYNNYDTGTPAVNPDGTYSGDFAMIYDGYWTPFASSTTQFRINYVSTYANGSFSTSGDGNISAYAFYDTTNATKSLGVRTAYYFKAPVTGFYDITVPSVFISASGKYYNGTLLTSLPIGGKCSLSVASGSNGMYSEAVSVNSTGWYQSISNYNSGEYLLPYVTDTYTHSFYVTKGDYIECLYYSNIARQLSSSANVWYSISMNTAAPTIVCRSYADSSDNKLTNQTNITINNDYSQTWNGNIYTDNSTNLTYIYPEYTTVNEKNETVTNISNNPIIYNNETKQYYTYDQTTNNYYYITYVTNPTPTPSPSPSPSPSPTPEPSETPDVTPTPSPDNPDATPTPSPSTPSITPTPTPGGGTSGGNSGNNSNISGGDDEGLFGWLWDLLKDLVKAILKAIFKVLSGILGFLIWLVERVGLLFPFLPAPAVAALGAGVVLVFVIKIIRFIRG